MSDAWELGRKAASLLGTKAERDARRAAEIEEGSKAPTKADIDRLHRAIESGWIGRGVSIGIGIAIVQAVLAFLLFAIWESLGRP